jgi:RNA polymerase sigma-70 factor (sigma-E family)
MGSQFAEYFTARAPAMRRLAYGLSGGWHAAEDLVQSTFVTLYRRWHRIRVESLDAYARRILVNAFLSERHSRRRESVMPEPPDLAASPGGDISDRLLLQRALTALPPRQRAMVVLRHLEDLSITQVADLLGVAEGTVKSQTARGIQSLRGALGDHALSAQ